MRIRIYPYKSGSRSAKALSTALSCLRLRLRGSRFRPRPSDVIINWGSSELPFTEGTILNKPDKVSRASDKIAAFTAMSNDDSINIPPFTTDIQVAREMINAGKKVVCRTLTRANSGRGIVIAETEEELVTAPLYTQYIPKVAEYRIHVLNGQVIDVQKKMRSREVDDENVNWQVRSHSNGFIFGREGVSLPDAALTQAVMAVNKLELDFGAVDLIYNSRQDTYYVLEVNTAPGLEGTTLERYKEAFNAVANV